jgi:hypothetical protein
VLSAPAAPPPRIVFVVMSAVTPAPVVDQLARALQPHRVLVHHDATQAPDFALQAPNAAFVPDPVRTGWASFGFVEGIFHSLRHALAHEDFDYLQLLSPTCLPIRPIADFERHVAAGADAHVGAIDLRADLDCLMSVGYRAFTPQDSLRHRVLRRLSGAWFRGAAGRRDEAGVWLHSGGGRHALAPLARLAVRAAAVPALAGHPWDGSLRPYYGSVWFGARRPLVQALVDGWDAPGLRAWCSRLRIAEEFLVPSLLVRAARTRGPLNHWIAPFEQARAGRVVEDDLERLRTSGAWFARKFPEDPLHPLRLRVLRELVGVLQPGPAPAGGGLHEAPQPLAVRLPEAVAVPAEPRISEAPVAAARLSPG